MACTPHGRRIYGNTVRGAWPQAVWTQAAWQRALLYATLTFQAYSFLHVQRDSVCIGQWRNSKSSARPVLSGALRQGHTSEGCSETSRRGNAHAPRHVCCLLLSLETHFSNTCACPLRLLQCLADVTETAVRLRGSTQAGGPQSWPAPAHAEANTQAANFVCEARSCWIGLLQSLAYRGCRV